MVSNLLAGLGVPSSSLCGPLTSSMSPVTQLIKDLYDAC